MEKIMFFSDSSSDLLPEDWAGQPFRMIDSSVVYDVGRVVQESEVDRSEYYQYLKTCKEIPTHSMAAPEQWLAAFENALENGYTHAVIITISSTASSVAQAVNIAWELFQSRHPDALTMELIDSRQYSMIYGRLLLKSFEMNRQGKSFREIVEDLRERTRRNHGILGAYSLRCLQKSGRISGMTAFVGGTLGLRPVLLVSNGRIAPLERVRGDRNVVPHMVEQVARRIVRPEEQDLMILHGDVAEEELCRMEALLEERFHPKRITRHTIGVTVITNCGPESIAVCFLGEPCDAPVGEH